MTAAQRALYFREWSQARAAMERIRGRKLSSVEADAERRRIHELAGAPPSSTAFSNRHLDAVLGVFWSWSYAASLDLQERQIDQPVTRIRFIVDDLLDRIAASLDTCGLHLEANPIRRGTARESYLLFLLRRLGRNPHLLYHNDFPEDTWLKVLAAIRIRYDQVQARSRNEAQGRPGARKAHQGKGRTRAGAPQADALHTRCTPCASTSQADSDPF